MAQQNKIGYPDLPAGFRPFIMDDDKTGQTLVGFVSQSGKITPLFQGSMTDTLTAKAGGGQSGATQLLSGMNRVTTVATAADSVQLPTANFAGLSVTVINAGANQMQVFGNGSDTINGVAGATGISQMQNSVVEYFCPVAGAWVSQGTAAGYSGGLATESAANGVSAAGTTQGTATLLSSLINRITTVGANAGVVLPASAAGLIITVINSGANTLSVYPDTGSTINGLGTNIPTLLPVGQTVTLFCPVAGSWFLTSIPPREVNTAISTVGAGTLTASGLVGSVITRSGSTSAYTDTTDTAANIIAALHGATVGQSWEVTIKNTVNFAETIAAGTGVTLSGQTIIPPNSAGRFLMTYSAAASVTMQGLAITPLTIPLSQVAYNAVSGNTPLTLTAANMAGQNEVYVNLTAALGGAGTVTTDTAANIIAQIPNAQVGQTYKLRIINSSSGAFAWTVAGGTNVTPSGTLTIAQNTWRDFVVTIATATTVTMQSVGTGTQS